VTAGLERGRALGYRVIFVQGSPHYYGRFGFAPASAQGWIMPFPGVPDEDNMALDLAAGSPASPSRELAARVDYPPPWDALK
jgi:putative acetyltransferase